ncbi:transposase family protein [Oerskovia sp. M15]
MPAHTLTVVTGWISARRRGVDRRRPLRLPKNPHLDNVTRDKILTSLRSVAERGNALIKNTWRALRLVTLDPNRLTQITTAALVLLHLQRGSRRAPW